MSPSCFTKHLNNSCFDSGDASRITCRIPEGTFKPDLKVNHRKKGDLFSQTKCIYRTKLK